MNYCFDHLRYASDLKKDMCTQWTLQIRTAGLPQTLETLSQYLI